MNPRPLFFEGHSGKVYPRYVKDLAGRIVICDISGKADSSIPYSVELEKFHFTSDFPLPWEQSVEEIERKIARYSSYNPALRSALAEAYPKGRLKSANFVFLSR